MSQPVESVLPNLTHHLKLLSLAMRGSDIQPSVSNVICCSPLNILNLNDLNPGLPGNCYGSEAWKGMEGEGFVANFLIEPSTLPATNTISTREFSFFK